MTILALSFLTPYFVYIPKAVLSAVLISAVVFLMDFQIVQQLWRGSSAYTIYLCYQSSSIKSS